MVYVCRDLEKLLNAHDGASTGEIYRECKWATLFDVMLHARAKYEGDGHVARRDAARFGLDLTSKIVELIPEDWGLGVLRGGMALLLKVRIMNNPLSCLNTRGDAHICRWPSVIWKSQRGFLTFSGIYH